MIGVYPSNLKNWFFHRGHPQTFAPLHRPCLQQGPASRPANAWQKFAAPASKIPNSSGCLGIICFLLFSNANLFAGAEALNQLVYEIRNPETPAPAFRQALETIGESLAREILGELDTKEVTFETLTGTEMKHHIIDEVPVLVTLLRAGIPLNLGVHRVFPDSEVGFIAISRDEMTLKAHVSYTALPEM